MDQPHSHITPGLPPRSNKKPGAFSHHSLSPRVAALLTGRQRELRDQGKNTTADVLAQLAARAAAVLEHECERNNRCTGGYLRPTMAALFWRDLSLRRLLRGCPHGGRALPVCRWAARNEDAARAVCIVELLSELAERATQPAEGRIDRHRRSFEAERRAWQLLCAEGLADQAEPHAKEALKHLVLTHILAREWTEWTPDRDTLLCATWIRLQELFGLKGNRIAAALVSAALNVPLSRWHTRYAVRKFQKISKNRLMTS